MSKISIGHHPGRSPQKTSCRVIDIFDDPTYDPEEHVEVLDYDPDDVYEDDDYLEVLDVYDDLEDDDDLEVLEDDPEDVYLEVYDDDPTYDVYEDDDYLEVVDYDPTYDDDLEILDHDSEDHRATRKVETSRMSRPNTRKKPVFETDITGDRGDISSDSNGSGADQGDTKGSGKVLPSSWKVGTVPYEEFLQTEDGRRQVQRLIDPYDHDLATRRGRPVWRWMVPRNVYLTFRTDVRERLNLTTREGRRYAAPLYRFVVQLLVGSLHHYDDEHLPSAAEAMTLLWGPKVAIPYDVLDRICARYDDVDRKRLLDLALSRSLIPHDFEKYGPGRCRRFRLRWDLIESVLQGCLSALEQPLNDVVWVNIVDGQRLSPYVRHALYEPDDVEKEAARLRQQLQRRRKFATNDEDQPRRLPLAWSKGVRTVRENLLRSAALSSPRLRARAARDAAILVAIRTHPTFRYEEDDIISYIPTYQERSAGRRYEQGFGFQTASRELKQALALGDARTGLRNYDLKSCHAWAYDALCSGLNQWSGFLDRTARLIPRGHLLELLTSENVWRDLAEESGLPEDALKAALYALINGGMINRPGYKVDGQWKLSAAGEIARDLCPGVEAQVVAEALHSALSDVSVQVMYTEYVLESLIDQGNMAGTPKNLRKIIRVKTIKGGQVIIQNAVGNAISAEEPMSRIISHILTGAEQHDIRLLERLGVPVVAYEHDGVVTKGAIPAKVLRQMREGSCVGRTKIQTQYGSRQYWRCDLREKPLSKAGTSPYDVRERELRNLLTSTPGSLPCWERRYEDTNDEEILAS